MGRWPAVSDGWRDGESESAGKGGSVIISLSDIARLLSRSSSHQNARSLLFFFLRLASLCLICPLPASAETDLLFFISLFEFFIRISFSLIHLLPSHLLFPSLTSSHLSSLAPVLPFPLFSVPLSIHPVNTHSGCPPISPSLPPSLPLPLNPFIHPSIHPV